MVYILVGYTLNGRSVLVSCWFYGRPAENLNGNDTEWEKTYCVYIPGAKSYSKRRELEHRLMFLSILQSIKNFSNWNMAETIG